MIQMSEDIAKLSAALCSAQCEVENATKNAVNPHFKNQYADLPAVLEAVRPVLNKHGLAVVQHPGFEDGVCTLTTMLIHKSGEWIQSESASPISKQDPQGIGSAVTYLRRYSLASLMAIGQADDDGNAASGPSRRANGFAHSQPPKPPTKTQKAMLEKIQKLLDAPPVKSDSTKQKDWDAAMKQANVSYAASDYQRIRKALKWFDLNKVQEEQQPEPKTGEASK
jgi:hypothetical protein